VARQPRRRETTRRRLRALPLSATRPHIANEIIQHLAALPDSEVDVTLEIQARVPGGVPDGVIRTVSENCRTLKFNSQHFEKE
jgi:hypothetical protein